MFAPLRSGQDVDIALVREYYTAMFADIKSQKDRIGGNFAVAHVIMFQEVKDIMR